MGLIQRDSLNILLPAAEAQSVASTAIDELNLQQVAYAINSAANTGELRTVIMSSMTDNTISELEAKGYKIEHKISGAEKTTVVSWG